MKTLKTIILALAAAALTVSAGAQTISDALRYSQYDYSLSTPRSSAMGGAFASLGADLSSMSLNPAGLGMYRSSEALIAPRFGISKMEGSYAGTGMDEKRNRFGLGSIGVALNLGQKSSGIVSVTLGFGYNRLADFNTYSSVRGNDRTSMLNYLANQANGWNADLLGHESDPFMTGGLNWGSALAYQTYLLNETSQGSMNYLPAWGAGGGTPVDMILRNKMSGGVDEYNFSAGLNVNNILYFGASIGLQDIYYKNENSYFEFAAAEQGPDDLDSYFYTRYHVQEGTGVNLKLGVIIRPIPNLRIGISGHTPTYTNMEYRYVENMKSYFNSPSNLSRDYDSSPAVNNYNVSSAPRIMGGISYSQPGIGLIAVDYERVWYNGMRINGTGDSAYDHDLKSDIKTFYRAANNIRAGIEITPVGNLFLRGGYAYYDRAAKNNSEILANTLEIKSYSNISGGIGYRLSNNMSVDLAYVYSDYKYADSEIYSGAADEIGNGLIKMTNNRHSILASLSYRF